MRVLAACCTLVLLLLLPLGPARAQASDPLLAEQLAELAMAATYLRNFELPAPRIETFIWPVQGRISSGFGWRNVSVGGNRNHGGIDIVADSGTPVAAAKSGTVTFAGWNGAYGYVIYVDHGDATQTRYAHLSAYFKGAGDVVVKGETIGYVGSTGASTGPHLHFEIRHAGVAVDPLPILQAAGGN